MCINGLKMIDYDLCLLLIICLNGDTWPPQSGDRVSLPCPFTNMLKEDFWVTDGSLDGVLFVNCRETQIVFQRAAEDFNPPLERLTTHIQLISDARQLRSGSYPETQVSLIMVCSTKTGEINTPNITMGNSTCATKTERTIVEDLGSEHLPIAKAMYCQEPTPPVTNRHAH